MTMMNSDIQSVPEYLTVAPKVSLPHLRVIRKELKNLIPKGVELIRYGIPTIQIYGKNVVHYGGYSTHIGFYPGSRAIVHFKKELKGYKTSKGTVQFSLDEQLPLPLIHRMVTFCVKEHVKKMKHV